MMAMSANGTPAAPAAAASRSFCRADAVFASA